MTTMAATALAGIQAGQIRAAEAASDIAQAHGDVAGSAGDVVSISGERPRDVVAASVDLRVARYQVAANVATLRTYDEMLDVWRRL